MRLESAIEVDKINYQAKCVDPSLGPGQENASVPEVVRAIQVLKGIGGDLRGAVAGGVEAEAEIEILVARTARTQLAVTGVEIVMVIVLDVLIQYHKRNQKQWFSKRSVMKFLVWQAGDFGYDSAAHVLSALVLLPLG
ncbi:hypothetical protein GQ600_23588 [Phytophthora cactorum]|nr:hypothetical protein GQ600_23588 [Phytophthora cactorum]